jgi:hypothetical protein
MLMTDKTSFIQKQINMKPFSISFICAFFISSVLAILVFRHFETTSVARKQTEIGTSVTVIRNYYRDLRWNDSTTSFEAMTPMGNRSKITVPVSINHMHRYLYQVEVLGKDSLRFIGTRSISHP